jgi:hypothetical protein
MSENGPVSAAVLEARRRAVASALRAEALAARVEAMSRQLTDVHARLAAVESMMLEASWESPALTPEEPMEPDERVAVPKLDLDKGAMSRTAAQALFGH